MTNYSSQHRSACWVSHCLNRLYTQTDNLTFIGAFFCDPFVSATERETRRIFHQAKKDRETSRSKTHPRNNDLSSHREEEGVRWTNSYSDLVRHTCEIISATRNVSTAPKHSFNGQLQVKASTYLSRWKYEHCTLPVCAASTLRSGRANSRRRSQASCSAPAQTPTNRHIQIKATTQQQQQQQQQKINWFTTYIRTRQYIETNLFHTFRNCPLSISTAWWIKKGTQKATVLFSILHVYNWNKQHVVNV
jgi:hypothetical protein